MEDWIPMIPCVTKCELNSTNKTNFNGKSIANNELGG